MNKKRIKHLLHSFIMLGLAVTLSSCGTTAPVSTPAPTPAPSVPTTMTIRQSVGTPRKTASGMYHSVAPGDTIWRIARMYDVDAESIKTANRIIDPGNIKVGRRLYIPDAQMRRNVLTLYPTTKWEYIIIHHSATDAGSSTKFDKVHRQQGWSGVGYHFIIDNGTYQTDDGQIESTPRWINQTDGAHCRANGMNYRGIGICLVGNFSENQVSEKQMESLVFLIQQLREFYDIPKRNIVGHGQVPGARTECPGTDFPWDELWRRL